MTNPLVALAGEHPDYVGAYQTAQGNALNNRLARLKLDAAPEALRLENMGKQISMSKGLQDLQQGQVKFSQDQRDAAMKRLQQGAIGVLSVQDPNQRQMAYQTFLDSHKDILGDPQGDYNMDDDDVATLNMLAGMGRTADKMFEVKKPSEFERKLELYKTDPAAREMLSKSGGGIRAPSNVQEWQYFSSLSPADQERYLIMKRSAQIRDMNDVPVQVNPLTGTAAPVALPGIAATTQPEIQSTLAAQEADKQRQIAAQKEIGKYEGETVAGAGVARRKVASLTNIIDNTTSQINDVLQNADWTTTGLPGAINSKIYGSKAYDQESLVKTIKANIGFDKLQEMRDLSPTGGALGQVAVQELEALQATIASLDSKQSLPQFRNNLKRVKQHYENWKESVNDSYEARYGAQESQGKQVRPVMNHPTLGDVMEADIQETMKQNGLTREQVLKMLESQ